jgi:hypothetical protein
LWCDGRPNRLHVNITASTATTASSSVTDL